MNKKPAPDLYWSSYAATERNQDAKTTDEYALQTAQKVPTYVLAPRAQTNPKMKIILTQTIHLTVTRTKNILSISNYY